jgi:hypothetical protein
MRLTQRLVVLSVVSSLALGLAAPRAWAQERHVVSREAMKNAIDAKNTSDAADRAAIVQAVHRPEAQAVADKLGLSLTRVDDAIATMSPSDVKTLASSARAAEVARAGGDSVTISLTALLLILILVVLIVK